MRQKSALAGVVRCTLSEGFSLLRILGALCGSALFTAEGAEKYRRDRREQSRRADEIYDYYGLTLNRSERVDQLPDLMTIALRFLGRFFRKLLVQT